MITKCANPSCSSVFRYLRGGKLFLVDKPPFVKAANSQDLKNPPGPEYFWLCASCIQTMTVIRDPAGHGMVASHGLSV